MKWSAVAAGVGKVSAVDQAGYQPDLSGRTGIPGKISNSSLLPPKSAADIGDPYIEGKGLCANGTGGQCFLNPSQRLFLVNAYQQEVLAAQGQYSAALTEVKMERLIQKEEELPMLYGLMLDVIGTQVLAGLTWAFKALRSGPETEIASGIEGMIAFQSQESPAPPDLSLRGLLGGVNEDAVSFILKSGIDETKKSLKKATPSSSTKKAALDYIGSLQETAAIAWEHQRQDPPGRATDGELIVLFHSFKAKMGHTTPRYVVALRDKVERFLMSQASIIGRNRVGHARQGVLHDKAGGQHGFQNVPGYGMFTRDTKVAWITYATDPIPVLHYYKRDAPMGQEDRDLNQELFNYGNEGDTNFKIADEVSAEFAETAIAKHRQVWGSEPEVIQVGGDKYLPPHLKAARAALSKAQAPTLPPAKPKSDPAKPNANVEPQEPHENLMLRKV